MPYNKRKQKCKQSSGKAGNYVLSYTDKKGKKHRACHTSEKNMQGQIAAIEAEADEVYGEEINEDIMRVLVKDFTNGVIKEYLPAPTEDEFTASFLGASGADAFYIGDRKELTPEEQAKANKDLTITQVVFRAIGYEIKDRADGYFIFEPPTSISGKKGIRINPKKEEAGSSELLNKVKEIVDDISWLEIDTETGGDDGIVYPGTSNSPSGKFTSISIKTIDNLEGDRDAASDFKVAAFKSMIRSGVDVAESNALLFGKPSKSQKPNLMTPSKNSLLGKFSGGKLPDTFFVVINSKSLSNKLFTTGITDLAEYAVAHAIDPGTPVPSLPNTARDIEGFISGNKYFKNCVEGNITKPNWTGAQEEQRLVFAKTYVNMVEKLSGHLSKVSKQYDVNFGNSILAAGGTGGAAYDVMTDTSNIHVKFDESGSMSRLSGIQKEKSKKDDSEEIKEKVKAALEVNATHRWQQTRDNFLTEFQGLPGVPPLKSKDTAWLAEAGFYSWLIPPHDASKVNSWLDSKKVPPEHGARAFVSKPPGFDIIQLMKNSITREFLNPSSDEGEEKKYFYITFFDPKDEVEASVGRIKIEQLGFDSKEDLEAFNSNIEIGIHPNYGSGQTTRPFAMFSAGDSNKTFLEFEFRNSDSSKPIQVHRGTNFSSAKDDEKSVAKILIDESVTKIFLHETLSEDLDSNLKLIVEELTGADKSEIKRMIAKEIEGTSNKRATQKVFQAEFNKELRKALGSSFIGEPGKINKFVRDSIRKEIESMFKDKATQNQIGDITKEVMKKLYRELSFSSVQVIDRIKM